MVRSGSGSPLLSTLRTAAMTADPADLAALLAEDARLEARLSEATVRRAGRPAVLRELARLWRTEGTLLDWEESLYADGAAVTLERLDEDGRLRRLRIYLRSADGATVSRMWVYEARPRPAAQATQSGVPREVLDRVAPGARREPLAAAGNSGGALERVLLPGGGWLVAKRVEPGADWIGRATHDPGREALLVSTGALACLPASIDAAVVAVEPDPRGGWWLLMRDVGAELARREGRVALEDACRLVRGAAELHAAFAGASGALPERAGLCSLADRLALHAPGTSAAERGGTDLVPKQLESGWECFADVAPADVAEAVLAVLDDPAQLAAATLAAGPSTLVHGDLREDNAGLTPGGLVLIDWGLAAWAPPAVDLAWYLLHDAWRVQGEREDLIDAFREAEGELVTPEALELSLLGGLVMYGWLLGHSAVIHPDRAERAWAVEQIGWWSVRARVVLERVWAPGGR